MRLDRLDFLANLTLTHFCLEDNRYVRDFRPVAPIQNVHLCRCFRLVNLDFIRDSTTEFLRLSDNPTLTDFQGLNDGILCEVTNNCPHLFDFSFVYQGRVRRVTAINTSSVIFNR